MKDDRSIMKLSQLVFLALGIWLIGGTTISSCKKSQSDGDSTSYQQTQTTTQTTPTATTTYVTEYPVYKTSTQAELDRNRDTILSIRARLKDANAKLRASLDKQSQALEAENAELRSRLDEYKDQGEEGWRKFKADFDRSMDSVKNAIKNMQTKIYIEHD